MERKNKEEGVRKGPWKSEEDEVLIKHVSKYGPRDWSSIRSKGLLQRTGKSCRLRWVNKLRPNLKNGCKFSMEEERVVIELQKEFGNKWARIATYLPGRTDNDVKNFWSSRQKRLARILHSSSSSLNSKSRNQIQDSNQLPIFEGRGFSSSLEGESTSSKMLSCSSSSNENSEEIKMASLTDLIKPKLISFEQDLICQPQPQAIEQAENNLCIDSQRFISLPPSPTIQPSMDLRFTSESHELPAEFDSYYDIFGTFDGPKLENVADLTFGMPFIEPVETCPIGFRPEFEDSLTPDCFFDDLPVDMFDQIETLPSPPDL